MLKNLNSHIYVGERLKKMSPEVAKIVAQIAQSLEKKIAGIMVNVVSLPFQMAASALKNAWSNVKGFNDMAVSTSRELGMGWRESIGYTQILIERAKALSVEYGVTAEQIAKIESNLASATGRAIILSHRDAEKFVAISKLIGEQAAGEYGSAFIRNLGGSVSSAIQASTKAYAKATQHGLSAAKFSAEVAKNLGLANKISFSQGVDGITRMTAMSEKLGINLSSIEGVVGHFSDFQDAISNSAKLQGLGGMAGIMGANPLTMMYESLNDVESLTERVAMMTKGLATFNEKTGMADLRGMNLEMTKYIADALGMSREEVATMARNQEKERYFEAHAANALAKAGGNQAMRDWLINKGQYNVESRKLELMTGLNGAPEDVESMTPERLEELWRESQMSSEEVVRQSAREVVSISERIAGIQTVLGAMLAEKVLPILGVVQQFLMEEGVTIAEVVGRSMLMLINPSFWKTSFFWIVAEIGNMLNPFYHLFGKDIKNTDWYKRNASQDILNEVGAIGAMGKGLFERGKKLFSERIGDVYDVMSATGKTDFEYRITDHGDVFDKQSRREPKGPDIKEAPTGMALANGNVVTMQAGNNPNVQNMIVLQKQADNLGNKAQTVYYIQEHGTLREVGRETAQAKVTEGQKAPEQVAQEAADEALGTNARNTSDNEQNKPHEANVGGAVLSTVPWILGARYAWNKVGNLFKGGGGPSTATTSAKPTFSGAAKNVFKSVKRGGYAMIGGTAANFIADNFTEKGSTTNKVLKYGGRMAEMGGGASMIGSLAGTAIGAIIGSIVPGAGTMAGAALGNRIGKWGGAAIGAAYGFYKARKELKDGNAQSKAAAEAKKESTKNEELQTVVAVDNSGPGDISRYGIGAGKAESAFAKKTVQAKGYTGYEGGVANDYVVQKPVETPKVAQAIGENTETVNAANASQQNGKVEISDFNINVGGAITLNFPNGASQQINSNELLNNQEFVDQMTKLVSSNIQQALNGGRSKWDVSVSVGALPVAPFTNV